MVRSSRKSKKQTVSVDSSPISSEVLRPPLRWAGGKRWLVPRLLPLWRNSGCDVYVEPFCGGLGAALGILPKRALLNDVNEHLINFYSWMQRGFRVTYTEMRNVKEVYYINRQRFNDLIASDRAELQEAAELFYYLNRTCYNGLCRFNSRGQFNTPFGARRNIRYRTVFSMPAVAMNWTFTAGDFADLVLPRKSFVYLDPPYHDSFAKYYVAGFSWKNQTRLADWAADSSCPIVISNAATPKIVSLYEQRGFQLQFLDGPRHISCTGDRRPAREILATKNIV